MSEKRLIAGRFAQGTLLGGGGMGDVYHGTDMQDDVPVAIKILRLDVVAINPEMLERFEREGEVLRQLDHPNIVKMLAVVEEEGRHMLVMEYVSGGSLRDLIESQGAQPIDRVLNIALDIADALTRAHRLKIIHRDIKPGNVLLAKDGTPRLTDFGVARMSDRTRMTETGSVVGTLAYLSPEACLGEEIEAASDIWAFGVMLFEMLTGTRPFNAANPMALMHAIVHDPVPDLRTLRPEIPPELSVLVQRMLAKDPADRIPSVRQVGAALEAILFGLNPPEETRAAGQPSRFGSSPPTPTTARTAAGAVPMPQTPAHPPPMPPDEQAAAPVSDPRAGLRGVQFAMIVLVIGILVIGLLSLISGGNDDDSDSTPTDLAAPTADVAAGEIAVVIAAFDQEGYDRIDAQANMIAELTDTIARSELNARVIAIPHTISDAAQAADVAAVYHAILVIYGSVSEGGAEVHVEITPFNPVTGGVVERPALENLERFALRVAATDVENFEAYVFEGMDAPYLMALATGVLLFYDNQDQAALGAFEQAEAALDTARAAQLQYDVLLYYRASVLYFEDDFDAALTAINAALELDPDNARYLAARGRIHNALRQYAAAVGDLSAALDAAPATATLLIERGNAYYGQGDYARAVEDFDAALALEPDNAWAYLSRANLYADQGDFDAALDNYAFALQYQPDFARAYFYRATVYEETGARDAAFADYSSAIRYDPSLALAYYQRALISLDRGDLEPAAADLDRYIDLVGGDDKVEEALALIEADITATQIASTPASQDSATEED